MRSEEFFNILDDIDDRIVSEIYEDVQRPQKITAVPRSPKRLPKLLLGSAACLAVIAAAGLAVRFAVPSTLPVLSGTSEMTDSLSPTSETNSENDSGSVTSESWVDWFSIPHLVPYKKTDVVDPPTETVPYDVDCYLKEPDESECEIFELIAADNGTVAFAGKISDKYGSGVVIKYAKNAYIAYGGLDPDSVTVSTGDTVTAGEAFALPNRFSCLATGVGGFIAHYKTSLQPISEEFFKSDCDSDCRIVAEAIDAINTYGNRVPDPDGCHHITANVGDEVGAIEYLGTLVYAGTDSEGSGMAVFNNGGIRTIYKGLDTTFPDFSVGDNGFVRLNEGDTVGYVGSSGDAYWFALGPYEFKLFAEENGIGLP